MLPLEKKTATLLARENLISAGETVLIAASGGPDSMALLTVLASLAVSGRFTIIAAHADHGLRPKEATRERKLVANEAKKLGIQCKSTRLDVKKYAQQKKYSIEDAARQLRYAFLEQTALTVKADKIALAHTADDQAEELLLRLIRGTGRKGLSGMQTMRDKIFIRPFLNITKAELLDYLARKNIPSCQDSSNTDKKFLRNRVRLELLPYLENNFSPGIRRTLLQTANILQEEERLFEKLANKALKKVLREKGNQKRISLKKFTKQPKAIQRRILEAFCWQMECRPGFRQIEHLLALAQSTATDKTLHLGDGLRVHRTKKHLAFAYPKGKKPVRGNLETDSEETTLALIITKPGTYDFGGTGTITIRSLTRKPAPKTMLADPTVAYLDAGEITFPLTLRTAQPGDRFHPLGAPGKKKVGDFLTDRKIAKTKRRDIPVLLSGDTILSLVGLRLDHRFRMTDQTKKILRISWQKK